MPGVTLSCSKLTVPRNLRFTNVQVSSLGALEEFLPFTDILPTATLAWVSRSTVLRNFVLEGMGFVDGFGRGPKDSHKC